MKWLIFYLGLYSLPSGAIVNGYQDSQFKAVVQLEMELGTCSGVVISLEPFLVLTARHCLYGFTHDHASTITLMGEHPMLNFHYPRDRQLTFAEKTEFQNLINAMNRESSNDIMLLQFDPKVNSKLKIAPNDVFDVRAIKLNDGDSILLCGWGSDSPRRGEGNVGVRRCGTNRVVTMSTALSLGLPFPATFPLNTYPSESLIIPSSRLREFPSAANWLNKFPWITKESGHADFAKADSGGAIFVRQGERNVLIGLSNTSISAGRKTEQTSYLGVVHTFRQPEYKKFFADFSDSYGCDLFLQ